MEYLSLWTLRFAVLSAVFSLLALSIAIGKAAGWIPSLGLLR